MRARKAGGTAKKDSKSFEPARIAAGTDGPVKDVDQFYDEMLKFYKKPPKHESPTRRLR